MGLLMIVLLIGVLVAVRCSATNNGSSILDKEPLIVGRNYLSFELRFMERYQINHFDFNRDLRKDPKWGENCSWCQTDLPAMREGKVGAQFWTGWANCNTQYKDAIAHAMQQIDVLKRFIAMYPDDLQFVDSAQGIEDAFAAGKIGSLIGLDGGHMIDSRLAVLRNFWNDGVRYMALAGECNTPWSHTAGDDGGLTAFGRIVVRELNRLGMMVDLTFASHQTMMDAIRTSVAPVIFSSSNAWAISNNKENVQDDVLRLLKHNGGIVMVNFNSPFLHTDGSRGTLEDVVAHINYIRSLIGVDYVGIGSSLNGYPPPSEGLEYVSRYPDLFDRLANNTEGEEKWSEEDLAKLAGRNFLRVFREVEQARNCLSNSTITEDLLPKADSPAEANSCSV